MRHVVDSRLRGRGKDETRTSVTHQIRNGLIFYYYYFTTPIFSSLDNLFVYNKPPNVIHFIFIPLLLFEYSTTKILKKVYN